MRRLALLLLVLAMAFALAPARAVPGASVVAGLQITPTTVSRGDTLTWVSLDAAASFFIIPHRMAFPVGCTPGTTCLWASSTMTMTAPTASVTIPSGMPTGSQTYYCVAHEGTFPMRGTVFVL